MNPTLTPRELAVLRLLAAGASTAEIGAALHLSTAVVKKAISSLLDKLGARNRAGAVGAGCALGLLHTVQNGPIDTPARNRALGE